jgi:hypothetical protein
MRWLESKGLPAQKVRASDDARSGVCAFVCVFVCIAAQSATHRPPPTPKTTKVAVQDLPGQGRGLVATQRLRAGEAVVHVPSALVISEESALKSSPLLQRLVGGRGLPSWTVLALWLAEQRYYCSSSGGSSSSSKSEWAPYLAALPQRPGTVLDWLPGEADRWLRGGLAAKACIILAAEEATWAEVAPALAEAEAAGAAPQGALSRDAVKWGVGILLSRSVRLDAAGGATVLVPFADFANHSPSADCFLDYDAPSDAVCAKLDRAYAAGEQVFISYGPKASGELLLSYGFAPPSGTNPHEAAFLEVALGDGGGGSGSSSGDGGARGQRRQDQRRGRGGKQQQQQQQQQDSAPASSSSSNSSSGSGSSGTSQAAAASIIEAKRAAMAAADVPDSEIFALRVDALPEGLLEYIAFCDAPCSSEADAAALAETLLGSGELVLPDGTSAEALAFDGLAARCAAALATYPADVDADRRLAAALAGKGAGYEQREAACAAVRLAERTALQRTEFVARQRAKQARLASGAVSATSRR